MFFELIEPDPEIFASGLEYKITNGRAFYFTGDEWLLSCKDVKQIEREIKRDKMIKRTKKGKYRLQ